MKDQELAKNMWSAIMAISLSSSVDIELRVINSMQAILSKLVRVSIAITSNIFNSDNTY